MDKALKKQISFLLILLFAITLIGNAQNHQKSTKTITSLSDYSFIGTGYGALTEPSTPAPGVYKPYVPDLTNWNEDNVINVTSSSQFSSLLGNPSSIEGKILVVANGTYSVKKSLSKLKNVTLISKNKWGAKITGAGPNFQLNGSTNDIKYVNIIGFEAVGNGDGGSDQTTNTNIFIRAAGKEKYVGINHFYIAYMKFRDYALTLYTSLHSHDITVDNSVHYNSTWSYLWYMMGWHHAVINSVMYNNSYYSLAIRGCFPMNESYSTSSPVIASRSKHFLDSDDWTQMIVNNTFGSNYKTFRKSTSHISLYYNKTEGDHNKEDIYFPPQNIVVANNVFIDKGDTHKTGMKVMASRGINTGAVDAVNGIIVKNNYIDNSTLMTQGDYSLASIDVSTCKTGVSSFGFDDANRDYTISSSSNLANAGATTPYFPNVDMVGNYRGSTPSIGAYEVPGETPGGGGTALSANFTQSVVSCSSSVSFTNTSSDEATSYIWNFGDGKTSTDKSPTHTYETPGKYSVKLTVSDGTNTEEKTSEVTVNFTPEPTNVTGVRNNDGTVSLSANASGTVNWYDVATGGTPIATGNNVNATSSKTVFYAENTPSGGAVSSGAKNSKGSGGYYEYEDADAIFGLTFNATSDFTLKSVKVYNGASSNGSYTGSRTFTVYDANSNKVAEKTVNVKDGEQRLELNMNIPKGNGYKLFADAHVGLWRDNSGTMNYPYSVGNDVTITGWANAKGANGTQYYYFFYDWEVEVGATGCTSSRVKVDLVTSIDNDLNQDITIYPNPANNYINIDNLSAENCIVSIYNSNMQQVKSTQSSGANNIKIDFQELSSGVYFCRITSKNRILTTKKIVIIK